MKGGARRGLSLGRFWATAIPYSWMAIFFIIPFFFVLKVSVAEMEIAQPPYTDLLNWVGDTLQIHINLSKYKYVVFEGWNGPYAAAYGNSLKIALYTTFLTLLIGYPTAYFIARASEATRGLLLMLIMLPFWTSFLLRAYAWIGILKNNGLINQLLIGAGALQEPIEMLYTPFAVTIGMVYSYLPFMVLPLYSHLVKLDRRLLEAAADLGARPWKSFLFITLPLSKGGIIAGSMMVFIPAVGEYVIPELLGGGELVMIGKKLMEEFGANIDWPMASAVAIMMILLLILPIALFYRFETREIGAKL